MPPQSPRHSLLLKKDSFRSSPINHNNPIYPEKNTSGGASDTRNTTDHRKFATEPPLNITAYGASQGCIFINTQMVSSLLLPRFEVSLSYAFIRKRICGTSSPQSIIRHIRLPVPPKRNLRLKLVQVLGPQPYQALLWSSRRYLQKPHEFWCHKVPLRLNLWSPVLSGRIHVHFGVRQESLPVNQVTIKRRLSLISLQRNATRSM